MLNNFAIECGRKVVGVAVRVRGGFRFFCSDPRFQSLDLQQFRRLKHLYAGLASIDARTRAKLRVDDVAGPNFAC